MNNIIEIVKEDLYGKNVSPAILEQVPSYVRRAVITLHKEGALPPRIHEFRAIDGKEEKRDENGNLIYNFIFLPDDFFKLDKFFVYLTDTEKNRYQRTYQMVSTDMLFSRRSPTDGRKFFAIADYSMGDERTRKILVLDPYPEDNDTVEIRYFVDGESVKLSSLGSRYWEPIISQVHQMIGITSRDDAEREITKETANWRNQTSKETFNRTQVRTSVVRGLFGKSV